MLMLGTVKLKNIDEILPSIFIYKQEKVNINEII
jgi:hypothetical protein